HRRQKIPHLFSYVLSLMPFVSSWRYNKYTHHYGQVINAAQLRNKSDQGSGIKTPTKTILLYIFKHKYFILELILLENLVYRQVLAAEALVELILITEDYMLFSA